MNLKNKQEIIEKFGANAKDTGSAEVQIAMLTKKISELTEHMKSNKKDFATKRGLLMMVGKRKRLLSFLKEKNLEGYRSLIKELGINPQRADKNFVRCKMGVKIFEAGSGVLIYASYFTIVCRPFVYVCSTKMGL